jgi:2-amino-4-hydroxy-6-hydroxymethyldihydropteridine diphosphokinase
MKHIAYIGIGSNVGDKARQCERGISELLRLDRHRLLARSSLYKTQPIGYSEQDWFINLVIKLETEMDAPALLCSLKEIESRLGRVKTLRWGPRAIDLDILFFNDYQIQADELTVPHPLIQDRQFVLVPLAEIDPDLTHPVLKKSVKELLEQLGEDQGVERLPDTRVP